MEKQEIKSKWDELAREIGAEVSPEAEQRAETHAAASDSTAIHAASSTPAVLPPLPKKQAADWAGLAGELGLPPVEEPLPIEKPVAKPPQRDERSEPQSRDVKASESQEREETSRESRSRRPNRGRGGDRQGGHRNERRETGEPSGQRREQRQSRRDRDEGRRQPREKRRGPQEKRRDAGEAHRHSPKPHEETAESFAEPQAATPPKSPAVSLWHKIFGSPVEPPAKIAHEPAEEASVTGVEPVGPRPLDDFGASEIRSLSGEDVTSAEFVEEQVEESIAAQDEEEQTERRRGRARRRRRGGRGRKSGRQREDRSSEPRIHQSGGDDQLGADFDDLDGVEDEMSDEDGRAPTKTLNGDSDIDGSQGERAPSRSMSAAQRAIPSWDDAIGFIVESNMQSRSQRRPPSRSDSRGNAPRGRSRGRRK